MNRKSITDALVLLKDVLEDHALDFYFSKGDKLYNEGVKQIRHPYSIEKGGNADNRDDGGCVIGKSFR